MVRGEIPGGRIKSNIITFYLEKENFAFDNKVYLKINLDYMQNSIGLKELRENVETYVSEVKKGKSFIVVRRSKPIFKIAPPDDYEGPWETVVDFTKFYENGISARQLLKKLRLLDAKS